MSDFYIFVSSKDYSRTLYPENNAHDFIIDLGQRYELEGNYECSLVQYRYASKSNSSFGSFIVFCDLCTDSYIREHKLPVLKLINTRQSARNPSTNSYMKLKTNQFNRLRIYLRDENLDLLKSGRLKIFTCVIHFRKCSNEFYSL